MLLNSTVENVDLGPVLEQFQNHGYARLGNLLSAEGCAALGAVCDQLMDGELAYDGLFFQQSVWGSGGAVRTDATNLDCVVFGSEALTCRGLLNGCADFCIRYFRALRSGTVSPANRDS